MTKPTKPATERPQIVVGPATASLIKAAQAGDYRALSHLYGVTGALLAADGPLPEPLLSFMRERLFAIAHALEQPGKYEYRDSVLKAVAPKRRSGPKSKTPALLPYTATEGLIAFAVERASGSFEERVADVAELFEVERTTVVEARRKVEEAGHLKP